MAGISKTARYVARIYRINPRRIYIHRRTAQHSGGAGWVQLERVRAGECVGAHHYGVQWLMAWQSPRRCVRPEDIGRFHVVELPPRDPALHTYGRVQWVEVPEGLEYPEEEP